MTPKLAAKTRGQNVTIRSKIIITIGDVLLNDLQLAFMTLSIITIYNIPMLQLTENYCLLPTIIIIVIRTVPIDHYVFIEIIKPIKRCYDRCFVFIISSRIRIKFNAYNTMSIMSFVNTDRLNIIIMYLLHYHYIIIVGNFQVFDAGNIKPLVWNHIQYLNTNNNNNNGPRCQVVI